MSYRLVTTALFEKQAKRLAKKYPSLGGDLRILTESLKHNPIQGAPLGKGLYKVRLGIQSKGQGKSGGARVITFLMLNENTVCLTSIYDKSEQSTISNAVLITILKEEGLLP